MGCFENILPGIDKGSDDNQQGAGLTGVASSKDRWVEASHWKSTISPSSSESFAYESGGMRSVYYT